MTRTPTPAPTAPVIDPSLWHELVDALAAERFVDVDWILVEPGPQPDVVWVIIAPDDDDAARP